MMRRAFLLLVLLLGVTSLMVAQASAGTTGQVTIVGAYERSSNHYDVVVRDSPPGTQLVLYVNGKSPVKATVTQRDRATFRNVTLGATGRLSFAEIHTGYHGKLYRRALGYKRFFQVTPEAVHFFRSDPTRAKPPPTTEVSQPVLAPASPAPPAPAAPPESGPTCGNGTYVNSQGNTVCRPEQSPTVPPGATARCVDGTYSFSQSRSGTCSHHGGVAEWLY
jgi:hypothetical protein